MGFFDIFKRNKNALSYPVEVRDSVSPTDILTQNEPSSFSAIDKIANSFSLLSFGVYNKKTKEKNNNHWLKVLLDEPNQEETHSLFFKLIIKDYFAGNIFLLKSINEYGEVISLFRCNPDSVRVTRDPVTHRKLYTYNARTYTSEQMLQIAAPYGYDGLKGHSIFSELRETFDTSKNLDAYTSNSFNNNLGKRLVIDASKAMENMSDEEQKKLRDKFVRNYAGVKNAGKPLVKTNGLEFSALDTGTTSNQSQELKENREFQSFLISQIFHIPLDMMRGATPAQIETLTTLYVLEAVQPIAQQIEESINRLMDYSERNRWYFEFSYNALLKTALTTRIDAEIKQLDNGLLTLDEARALENRSPVEAGQTAFRPVNTMPWNEDTKKAYMAKQKNEAAKTEQEKNNPTDPDQQHFAGGDDKQ